MVETSKCSKQRLSEALVDLSKQFWKAKAAYLIVSRTENSEGREAF